ncbi:MAG: murein L,D-transpeptidase catalytic domain family protein [Verrucomicrobiales bacterium]|nr:murein L,D-transpeptidase catalytic domain family protein [Verrucomicrobiales bacterium]
MVPRTNTPIERTLMAIPTVIVLVIMGSTVVHLAGETIVSTLSTAVLTLPADGNDVIKQPVKRMIDESALTPVMPVNLPRQEDLVLSSKPELPENFLIPPEPVLPLPRLSESELAARQKIIAHLGGESEYFSLEEDMEAAFSAAKYALKSRGVAFGKLDVLAVADFTKPSYIRRLSIFNPRTGKETRHLVAHGTRSGKLYAKNLSNRVGSLQSSPGLYQVGRKYRGSHGASLKLHGLEEGINDKALRRAIVMHSAWYVSYKAMVSNLKKEGVPRLGCSHGCPAVHAEDLEYVLGKLKPGSYLYIYSGT